MKNQISLVSIVVISICSYVAFGSVCCPSPGYGAASVDIFTQLSWSSTDGGNYTIYLGTNPTNLAIIGNADPYGSYYNSETGITWSYYDFDPYAYELEFDTQYFWKVSGSDIWTFTTVYTLPLITAMPQSVSVGPGQSAQFTTDFWTVTECAVEWYHNGSFISSGTVTPEYNPTIKNYTATLNIENVQTSDAGEYYCVVTNAGGPGFSSSAELTVPLHGKLFWEAIKKNSQEFSEQRYEIAIWVFIPDTAECYVKGPQMVAFEEASQDANAEFFIWRSENLNLSDLQTKAPGVWTLKFLYRSGQEGIYTFSINGTYADSEFLPVPEILTPAPNANNIIAQEDVMTWDSHDAHLTCHDLWLETGGEGFIYRDSDVELSAVSWEPGWLEQGDAYFKVGYVKFRPYAIGDFVTSSGPVITTDDFDIYTEILVSGDQHNFTVKYSLDFNDDGIINLSDLDVFISQWLCQNQSNISIADGLVGHWSFDEGEGDTAFDDSGHGNIGAIFGATYVDGVSGKALDFDGIDDYVDCGNSTELNPVNQITLAAWYKSDTFSGLGNDPIIDKGYTSHTFPHYQYHLGVTGNQYYHDIAAFNFSTDTEGCYIDHYWSPDNWYFIVGTYDGTILKLYINGEITQVYETNLTMTDYGKNLLFGKYSNLNAFLPGTIDEIRIYNRSLTDSEICYLYNVPSGEGNYPADFNDDGIVNLIDFAIFSKHWLEGSNL